MIPEILAKTGRIDILHCNAGSYIGGDLIDTNADAIDRMLNLNVNAVIKNVHAVLPHMIERRTGDIVVTSSIAGHAAIKPEPVYSPSKWAMTSFTKSSAARSTNTASGFLRFPPGRWTWRCSRTGCPIGCRRQRTTAR